MKFELHYFMSYYTIVSRLHIIRNISVRQHICIKLQDISHLQVLDDIGYFNSFVVKGKSVGTYFIHIRTFIIIALLIVYNK